MPRYGGHAPIINGWAMTLARVLKGRGLVAVGAFKSGGDGWTRAAVKDAATGEAKGERWLKHNESGWDVRKAKP